MTTSIGVAVIGAGMAGKAHAAAYRTATTVNSTELPKVRLVSIADLNQELAEQTAQRYGFERFDTGWQAIAEAEDIDAVSVVTANKLHREVVEGLLAAGKHVLCEKPLSNTLAEAEAMVAAARHAKAIARIGLTFRRSPGVAYIRQLIQEGVLGKIFHLSGRSWADYSVDPQAPMSWRYQGAPGSGALADLGSHINYLAEFLCGDMVEVSGGRYHTAITQRPKPLGAVVGHEHVEVSDEYEPVSNEDYATFSAQFAEGSGVIEISRIATGHPNTVSIEIFGDQGAARWDQRWPAEVGLFLNEGSVAERGFREIFLGPEHPYFKTGLPMDAPGVGLGHNDYFVYQCRAFLEEIAGVPETEALPRCATLEEGLHNMQIQQAVSQSVAAQGASVPVPAVGSQGGVS